MKCILQRVNEAQVYIDNKLFSSIEQGILVFICAEHGDTEETVKKAVDKILKLRIFSDTNDKMNLSLQQINGSLLVVSQFTLAADTSRGNRPSFTNAANPTDGEALYEYFLTYARSQHNEVTSGSFGANMQIHLINNGPVTIPLDF